MGIDQVVDGMIGTGSGGSRHGEVAGGTRRASALAQTLTKLFGSDFAHDFQIVKTHGKNVPDINADKKKKGQQNLFPAFTTWREQVDGKYWFPTYTLVKDATAREAEEVAVHAWQVLNCPCSLPRPPIVLMCLKFLSNRYTFWLP